MWDVNFLLTWILWYLWYIVGFHIIMLPVVSWSGRPHVKMEANYWIEQGVYCTYVMFHKSRTWFFSVCDCWHDYERQYQSYTFTLDKWLKMSIITYVGNSQRSRTRLCSVMSNTFLTFLDLTLHKSNNYRSGIIKIYLSSASFSLSWYIYSVRPTYDVPRSTWTKNKHIFSTPTTYHQHISQMGARFDLAGRLLQRTIRQVTFAHTCIAIDPCKKWWCVVKDRGNVRDAHNGFHPFRNKWLLKSQGSYKMTFHRNKTWDFRVQVFISVISFQRNYTKWWVLSWENKNIWLNVTYVTFVFRTHKNYVKSSRSTPLWS